MLCSDKSAGNVKGLKNYISKCFRTGCSSVVDLMLVGEGPEFSPQYCKKRLHFQSSKLVFLTLISILVRMLFLYRLWFTLIFFIFIVTDDLQWLFHSYLLIIFIMRSLNVSNKKEHIANTILIFLKYSHYVTFFYIFLKK